MDYFHVFPSITFRYIPLASILHVIYHAEISPDISPDSSPNFSQMSLNYLKFFSSSSKKTKLYHSHSPKPPHEQPTTTRTIPKRVSDAYLARWGWAWRAAPPCSSGRSEAVRRRSRVPPVRVARATVWRCSRVARVPPGRTISRLRSCWRYPRASGTTDTVRPALSWRSVNWPCRPRKSGCPARAPRRPRPLWADRES